MLYRIYTERTNTDKVKNTVSQDLEGFTVLNGTGYWHGQSEKSLIIEAVLTASEKNKQKIRDIAQRIKDINSQDAVLIQSLENNSEFI